MCHRIDMIGKMFGRVREGEGGREGGEQISLSTCYG